MHSKNRPERIFIHNLKQENYKSRASNDEDTICTSSACSLENHTSQENFYALKQNMLDILGSIATSLKKAKR